MEYFTIERTEYAEIPFIQDEPTHKLRNGLLIKNEKQETINIKGTRKMVLLAQNICQGRNKQVGRRNWRLSFEYQFLSRIH